MYAFFWLAVYIYNSEQFIINFTHELIKDNKDNKSNPLVRTGKKLDVRVVDSLPSAFYARKIPL